MCSRNRSRAGWLVVAAMGISLLAIGNVFAYCDLFAPATVRMLSDKHPLWDTIEITTSVENISTTDTAKSPLYPSDFTVLKVGIDSLWFGNLHRAYKFQPWSFTIYKDTAIVLKTPFSLYTWIDPLHAWNEGGAEVYNNVLSWTYNFHPEITYDTVRLVLTDTLRDTVRLHDTLTIVRRDTIIHKDTLTLTKRDTLIHNDTIVVYDTIYPTAGMTKKIYAAMRPAVHTEIYNIVGQLVWNGNSPEGIIPRIKLPQGTCMMIQGDKRKLLKVSYTRR
jgi:hypothetical protein